jgi:hypothetical protein
METLDPVHAAAIRRLDPTGTTCGDYDVDERASLLTRRHREITERLNELRAERYELVAHHPKGDVHARLVSIDRERELLERELVRVNAGIVETMKAMASLYAGAPDDDDDRPAFLRDY